jgi:hypothetical protein
VKKSLLLIFFAVFNSAQAASVITEYQNASGFNGSADQKGYLVAVREDINKTLTGDLVFLMRQTNNTNSVSNRLEVGLTPKTTLFSINPYTRFAVGERFTSTGNYSYYSVEPGIVYPNIFDKFSARVGWRYRNSFLEAGNDETRTWGLGVSYPIIKSTSLGVRYDRTTGDSNQNTWNFNLTKSF